MYCYVHITNLLCVFNELILWTEISKEHPVFVKTVAQLTNKNLSKNILDKLDEINIIFSSLQNKSMELKKRITYSIKIHCSYVVKTGDLIEEFLAYDKRSLSVLQEVKEYGKEDMVWQTLLQHIGEEQTFMYKLFTDLLKQFR
ncbi:DUF2935 domain-containing protein [Fonticella tunisiensis]|uniref:DUF2935 family protein n=1 Tax=Fonticella tunisiensis TaxID=1096341 RepID=A0A4R7KQI2_9CLOT|nr:DUF2935 domain-containing protein [Fonticella tunisiensis]TDT60956.1 DUF2935 family protein [Fonticella tunisiensis]